MTTIPCQFTSPKNGNVTCERIALCTLKKASLTVEAAVILPLFLLAMTMLISIIDICRIKIEAQAELTMYAKELSMYAYMTPDLYEDGYVDLYKIETFELPVQLFPVKPIPLAIRARVHTWTGRNIKENQTASSDRSEEMVYVTDRETVYHTNENCSHLKLTIVQVGSDFPESLLEEKGSYLPCEKCCGKTQEAGGQQGGEKSSTYYITESGDAYHVSLNCSSLSRTVRMVKVSEIGPLKECERCKSYKGTADR